MHETEDGKVRRLVPVFVLPFEAYTSGSFRRANFAVYAPVYFEWRFRLPFEGTERLLVTRPIFSILVFFIIMVPKERLELSHPCGYWILSPARLPFHHFGTFGILVREANLTDEGPPHKPNSIVYTAHYHKGAGVDALISQKWPR